MVSDLDLSERLADVEVRPGMSKGFEVEISRACVKDPLRRDRRPDPGGCGLWDMSSDETSGFSGFVMMRFLVAMVARTPSSSESVAPLVMSCVSSPPG